MENINKQQRELLEKLQRRDPALEIHWDEARGVASSIRGSLGNYAFEVKEGHLDVFLQEYGPLFGPPELPEGLRLQRHKGDELGWDHLFFQHWVIYGDELLEVYGAKLAAHADQKGELIEVQSSMWRDLKVNTTELPFGPFELYEILTERIQRVDGFDRLRKRREELGEEFSLFDEPRMAVYPWQGNFRLAWITHGYSEHDKLGVRPVDTYIAYGRIFIDAATGERFLFAPTLKSAETAAAGTGLAVTPLNGPYKTRNLNVVRVDTSSTYRLKDTTHDRPIVTYDAECSESYDEKEKIATELQNGTLPVSQDTDGDHHWDRLPTGTPPQRTLGQQPEVDAHHHVRLQYEWYDAISGGRDGWDIDNALETLHVFAHWSDSWGGCQSFGGYEDLKKVGTTWITWLAFLDGDASAYDYPAGSHWLVAHEYQHAITDFSYEDGGHDPLLMYTGWLEAVHEGLSDAFAGLSTEQWLPGRDISHSIPPKVYRNLVFPRDPTADNANKLDHFDDRDNPYDIFSDAYEHGAILAHCAYLMGKGGVHQRATRDPEYIPVQSLGRENFGGMNVPKAARIWYRALTCYFSTLGGLTGIPGNDEETFRKLRKGCISAAADIYVNDPSDIDGSDSAEYRNTILAFYAVGLHPTEDDYGPDPTFLRWGVNWDLSRQYVGLNSPDYASLDLFINNGGASEWNALINVANPNTGLVTDYENTIYCRVRNVGDQAANNVEVEFHYAKVGTVPWAWLPVVDKNGVAQKLIISTLDAGQSNFLDSDQNSPPASAGVKWCILPLAPGEVVDHFCLRARVTSSNDVNDHNNEVQSNIAYTSFSNPTPTSLTLHAGNPSPEIEIPLDLRLDTKLPKSWSVSIKGVEQGLRINPREQLPFELIIEMTSGDSELMEPPLDGDMFGEVHGDVAGKLTGSLTNTLLSGNELVGQVSGPVHENGTISGSFEGEIDRLSGELRGYIIGSRSPKPGVPLKLEFHGCLRPWRRVDVSQWHNGEIIGGVTIQVQVPRGQEPCGYKIPPTDTRVKV